MDAMDRLKTHMDGRLRELTKKRSEGVKVVGYAPGGYMPEEMVYAAGAIPVCLIRGGDHEPVAESGAYIPRFIDTFCRSQIGYRMLEDEPIYQLVDLLIVPITDQNMRAVAETWSFYTDVDVFRHGVPCNKEEAGYQYYLGGLLRLKDKLESFTGNKIEDGKLREAIELWNRMRSLFKEISLLRKGKRPPISGEEFARLSHASLIADPPVFVEILESLLEELKKKEGAEIAGPRILLTGSTLAMGDYKVFPLVQGAGAEIVIEEFAEGIREYWNNVEPNGNLIEAIAETYFKKRVPPAWFSPSVDRIDFVLDLAKDFGVEGILWYQLLYRDAYDMQTPYFEKMVKEKADLRMLKVESDYDISERGPMKTRIEAFIEMLGTR